MFDGISPTAIGRNKVKNDGKLHPPQGKYYMDKKTYTARMTNIPFSSLTRDRNDLENTPIPLWLECLQSRYRNVREELYEDTLYRLVSNVLTAQSSFFCGMHNDGDSTIIHSGVWDDNSHGVRL